MNKTSKAIAIVAGLVFSAAILFKTMHWDGASILLVLWFIIFIFIYLPYWLYNQHKKRIAKLYCWSQTITLALFAAAVLFKVQHWPAANVLMTLSIVSLLFLYIPSIIKKYKKDDINTEGLVHQALIALIFIGVMAMVKEGPAPNSTNIAKSLTGSELARTKIAFDRVSLKSERLYEAFNLIPSKEKNNDYKNSIILKQLTDSTIQHITNTENNIIDKFGKNNLDKHLFDARIPSMILFNEINFIANRKFTAKILKQKINFYRDSSINLISGEQKNFIKQGINLATDNIKIEDTDYTWEDALFLDAPLISVLNSLSQLKYEVKNAESQILSDLLNTAISGNKVNVAAQIAELELKYDMQQHEKKIALLQKDNELAALKDKDNKLILNNLTKVIVYLALGLGLFTIMIIIIIKNYIYSRKLLCNLEQQKKDIEIKNEELITANEQITHQKEELTSTIEHLKQTQAELIQSEKMASLGQLIAGIAHEINTPLGAIKASVNTITDSSIQTISSLPLLVKTLSDSHLNTFISMVNRSATSTILTTSKEEREYRKLLTIILEQNAVENADEIADILVDMSIFDEIEPFLPVLNSNNMHTAYHLSMLIKNSNNIKLAVDKASKVVFALKNYSRFSNETQMIKANITDGIDTVLVLYHNQLKHGITLHKEFKEVPLTNCYPDELNQVWTNLIHNGIQAMQGKGDLTIKVETQTFDDLPELNPIISVSVSDTGSGITPENLNKIFNAFFTTKPAGEGSGLGLYIVKQIIDKHHGKILVNSTPGKGTTFTVELPVIMQ